MAASYTKSLASDFGNSITPHQLHQEIEDSSITSQILHVTILGDSVDIVFDSSLSAGDQTTLDALVAAHTVSSQAVYSNIVKFTPRSPDVKQSSYKREDTLIYEGKSTFKNIVKISAVSYMNEGVTSYTIKVYDKTHNQTVAESTFTNTTEDVVDLTPIQNVPTEKSVLELLVKKTGGNNKKRAYVDSVTMYLL